MSRRPGLSRTLAHALLGLVLLAAPGCYTLHAASSQLGVVCGSRDIDDVLADPDTSSELRRRLELVREVRRFAIDSLGLEDSESYTTYYDTGPGQPIAWNVSGSAPDALAPVLWSFPLLGALPYIGYFDKPLAEAEAARLRAEGLDVVLLGVPAYSTLGWFDDPVFSSMLERGDASIAETVIHEMAHATVWVDEDADFNETLATFIGQRGAEEFFRARGGPTDPGLLEAHRATADSALFNDAIARLRGELQRIYEASGPRARKLELKQQAFARFRERFAAEVRPLISDDAYDFVLDEKTHLDNALVLAFFRYHGRLDLFRGLERACGGDLSATVNALRELAEEDDPRASLEARFGARGGVAQRDE